MEILAIVFGIVPAIIWLWFWLKQDKSNPEPKRYIVASFLVGMITVMVAGGLEKLFLDSFVVSVLISALFLSAIEELLKFFAAYFIDLKQKYCDEPVDMIIYMITVALGFSALENVFYVWSTFMDGQIANGVLMSNMRFIGATVLHGVASGIVGVSLALSFYKTKFVKILYLLGGLVLATGLHAVFNFLIIDSNGESTFNVFVFVWSVVVFLLYFFEKAKQLKCK